MSTAVARSCRGRPALASTDVMDGARVSRSADNRESWRTGPTGQVEIISVRSGDIDLTNSDGRVSGCW